MQFDSAATKAEEFARTMEDVLVKAFESPKDAIKSLFDYFKAMLFKMVAQAIMHPIVIPMTTAMFGGPAGAGAYQGAQGLMQAGLWEGGPSIGGLAGAGMAGYGIGGLGGAIGGMAGTALASAAGLTAMNVAGLLGGVGPAMFSVLSAVVPFIGPILGILAGTLLSDLFSGGKKVPAGVLTYHNWNFGPGDVGSGWQAGITPSEQGGAAEFAYQDMEFQSGADAISRSFIAVRQKALEMWDEMGMSIDGFSKEWKKDFEDMTGWTQEQIDNAIRDALGEYVSFATGVDFSQWQQDGETLIETVDRVMKAMAAMPDAIASIGDYIDAIADGDDEVAAWRRQMEQANESIADMQQVLQTYDETSDPSDVLATINQLSEAIYQRYQAEISMVQKLDAAIKAIDQDIAAMFVSVAQAVANLTGNFDDLVASLQSAFDVQMSSYSALTSEGVEGMGLSDLDQALAALSQMFSIYGQMVQAQIDAIEASYQAQMDAIDAQIEALSAEKDAIEEAAEARIDALTEEQDAISEQIDALQESLSIAQAWRSVLDSVSQQILDMQSSTDNPQDVFERMAYLRAEIERVQGLYQGATGEERVGYASQLQELIGQYLGVVQEAYDRPSAEYQAIYDEMLGLLKGIQDDATANSANLEDIQAQIKALQERSNAIQEEIKAIQEETSDKVKVIDDRIEALRKQQEDLQTAMTAEITATKTQAAEWYTWYQTEYLRIQRERQDLYQAKLVSIIGDQTVEEFTLKAQKDATAALVDLQAWAKDYWEQFKLAISGTGNTPTPSETPAPSETPTPTGETPGTTGVFPWLGSAAMAGDYATAPNVTISPIITVNVGAGSSSSAQGIAAAIEDQIVESAKRGKLRELIRRGPRG